ncbi:phosphatidylethanolamine-binding protein homolog F40A3.3-like [Bicyclus anynana]|uniref:Phosphatidylethanolamine-binding protein homolog F40A3.3-like n=1 Tax=Bicyclus anynana TaxID=110368 RepID=A0ABM3LXK5_BICAN|nr:phosphatidylethanolamine-binding protein homolog F40A3.3-like [Bicyclus anynana]
MKLVFACLAVLFLSSALAKLGRRKKPSVADAFDDAGITEILNITAPKNWLKVKYGPIEVKLGNDIYPGDTILRPTISFDKADPDAYYTWCLLDPNYNNYPAKSTKRYPSSIYALYVNIRNLDIKAADVLASYAGPVPGPGTGEHYYVHLYWQQKGKIDVKSRDLPDYEVDQRYPFNLTEFLSQHNYCDEPAAGNFHTASFPDDLQEVCEEGGYCQ